ncbi:MAG: type II toxin-antitoxin system VapC family toxin [Candidatus Accumulibacter sp.]|jgi:tRNA(fMet)-specific endonuclease VapC|nr:type II toxin-antitoxin system VapC family toxin [Accumulibacter sp.]
MIKAMLDTNILIHATRNGPPEILERLARFRKGEIVISSIAWAEYCVGAHKLGIDNSPVEKLIDILPFDAGAGNTYGMLTAKHSDRASGFDRLVAAHAIAVGVTLVTNNPVDFALYLDDGLAVENWV